MNKQWSDCKNILCIRPDNMGDLLMSSPAIRALKETFHCKITVLTSSMAKGIVPFIPEIDEVLQYDLPWIKTNQAEPSSSFYQMIEEIKARQFDAAVIFTVYSQNPLPSALLAYLAGIPKRLAYCRENPYALLTHWIPDKEPYTFVQHQVQRDLALVADVGAFTANEYLLLQVSDNSWVTAREKLVDTGVDIDKPWLIIHAGVSEQKRRYPKQLWIETCKQIINTLGYQIILTGTSNEKNITTAIQEQVGSRAYSIAGMLSLEEFIMLIKKSPLAISVNTATIHIAAAVRTPVIVLYALTNPQHSPWKAKGKVLIYDIPEKERSRNEVIRYVNEQLHLQNISMVTPDEIIQAVYDVLWGNGDVSIPAMIPLKTVVEKTF